MVSAIRPDGSILRAPPGKFGGITNAHHIKIGGPWDSTFEHIFGQSDSDLNEFISWMFTLEAMCTEGDRPMLERILAQPLPSDRQAQMARISASLLARSPRVRYVIELGINDNREQASLLDPAANNSLIAANQRGLYEYYLRLMQRSGRWAVLFSDSAEFIAGDGFFHNFPASEVSIHSGRKLILPILPTAAIVYMNPTTYPSEPKLVTLRVDRGEAAWLNGLVQIYARRTIFFRSEKPVLSDAFRCGKHRELEYNQHEWLEGVLDDLSQYSLWGKGGAPEMRSQRPFSKSITASRMLDQLARRDQ